MGGTGDDDGVSYRLVDLKVVSGFPVDEYSDPVRAPAGAKLVRADIVVKNNTKVPLDDPFCGSQNAVLVDDKGRNFNIHEDNLDIANNHECDEIAPGFQSRVILAFQVPTDSKIKALAVWNADAPDDYSGASFVRFQK